MARIRLLIADDSAEFRNSARLMLSLEDDIEVVSMARDGQETVELARRFRPDVAVIDVHMPKLDGIAAMQEVAQVSPETVCMVISYEGEREVLRRAMAAGARDYLIKPFNTDEFVNAIRRVAAMVAEAREKADLARAAQADALEKVEAARAAEVEAQEKAAIARAAEAEAREKIESARAAASERDEHLQHIALTYLKDARLDPEATRVYAELSMQPDAEVLILKRLAEIFLVREDWQKLRLVCERMEKLAPRPPK